MSIFERYLSLWVALCIVAGVLLGASLSRCLSGHRSTGSGTGEFARWPVDLGDDYSHVGQS